MKRRDDPNTALCFDFGQKRIGVAAATRSTGTTTPLSMLPARHGEPDWRAVASLVLDWQPDVLLIGWPLNMDGSEGVQCPPAHAFGTSLAGLFDLPVLLIDERLSSFEARARLHGETRGRRERRPQRPFARSDPRYHAVSAQVIAESWLAEPAHARRLGDLRHGDLMRGASGDQEVR